MAATVAAIVITAVPALAAGVPPSSVGARAAADDNPYCLSATSIPQPPSGTAVFALNFDPGNPSFPNILIIPRQWTYDPADTPRFQGCDQTLLGEKVDMTDIVTAERQSVAVAPGAAMAIQEKDFQHNQTHSVLWGAESAQVGRDARVSLYPGESVHAAPTSVTVLPADQFETTYHSCRACALVNAKVTGVHLQPDPNVSYQRDLSRADMTGAALSGDFSGWNLSQVNLTDATLSGDFSGANLSGAVLDHTVVDGTKFDQADLRGARLVGLRYTAPPSFADVRIGPFNGSCTVFQDSDLLHTGLVPANPDPGCESSPLLPGSEVPLDSLGWKNRADIDFAGARFVDSGDRAEAGADLSGIDLSGASFIGYPADLARTNFAGASLQRTGFELADLAGAKLANVHAAGADFRGANLNGASFAGAQSDLQGADFVEADVSGASFQSADLSGAAFDDVLAEGTDFNSVVAKNGFFKGAHIYGDGGAFDAARDLTGADFADAVLAGNVSSGGGFDFTGADLTGAKFDGAQCISCNFSGSSLASVSFSAAYLPGAVFSGATDFQNADLTDAWLYCGDLTNGSCPADSGSSSQWDWPLALGSQELFGPVPFANTDLSGVSLASVTACPDGNPPAADVGCAGRLLPSPAHAPPIPAPCSAAGLDACLTPVSTIFDASAVGAPISIAAATPPTWSTTLTGQGYYAGFDDGTIRLVGDGPARVVAGRAGQHCQSSTATCGDGGKATQALLGAPAGLTVGLHGSLYVADPALHRVRLIDPSGNIITVAGSGADCDQPALACGDGGSATSAALSGPYGVWRDPAGDLFIADGPRGIRELLPDRTIITLAGTAGTYDVRDVAGGPAGDLYATTNDPDYLLRIDLSSGNITRVVGTGISGYNGNTDPQGGSLLPGSQVQVDHPEGLSVALNGKVIFADTGNDLIRAYVPSSGHVAAVLGGLVPGGAPQGGYNGDGRYANQTQLNRPRALALTSGPLLIVADSENHRVRELGPSPTLRQLALGAPSQPSVIACKTATSGKDEGRAGKSLKITCTDEPSSHQPAPERPGSIQAALSRGRVTYATGTSTNFGGRSMALLLAQRRPLAAGRYTLTLRDADRRKPMVQHYTVTIG